MAIRILFDNKELSSQGIMSLSQSGQLFDSSFKLGTTLCRNVKLEVNSRYISNPRPSVVKIYDDETIKFTLYVDSVEKVDDYTYSYTLCDAMVKLNVALSDVFKWDTTKSYTVQTICDNICDYIGSNRVTVDYIGSLAISWDWDTLARDFLSYIAEINASYVRINASGNIEFIEHKNATTHTLDVETCEDIAIGEYHCIQRVGYEQASASIYYPTTEVDYNTVYINEDNILITDTGDFTREDIIKHIYDKIVGFEFYCLTTNKCEIAQDCIAGDLINTSVINDQFLATAKGQILANTLGQKLIARFKKSIPTIAQIEWSYNAKWNGGYSLDIETDVQEETQIVSETERKVKSLKITVDRELGQIKQEVQDVDEKVDDVSTTLTTKYSTTEQTAASIKLAVSQSKTEIEGDVANTYATKASLDLYVKENEASSKVASWIEASADNIIIKYTNSLIFGNYPNGQYMQARTNDSNNGVLFKGTGTFSLNSVGDFNLTNYTTNEYSKIKNCIITRDTGNSSLHTQYFEIYNYQFDFDGVANLMQMVCDSDYNSLNFINKTLNDSYVANFMHCEAYSDAAEINLANRKDSTYDANRLYLGRNSYSDLIYLSNFKHDSTYLANQITLSASSSLSYLQLSNYHKDDSTSPSNIICLSSNSVAAIIRLQNNKYDSSNYIDMQTNSDGSSYIWIRNNDDCHLSLINKHIQLSTTGTLNLVCNTLRVETGLITDSSTILSKDLYWCRYNLLKSTDYVLASRS